MCVASSSQPFVTPVTGMSAHVKRWKNTPPSILCLLIIICCSFIDCNDFQWYVTLSFQYTQMPISRNMDNACHYEIAQVIECSVMCERSLEWTVFILFVFILFYSEEGKKFSWNSFVTMCCYFFFFFFFIDCVSTNIYFFLCVATYIYELNTGRDTIQKCSFLHDLLELFLYVVCYRSWPGVPSWLPICVSAGMCGCTGRHGTGCL